MSTLRFMLRTDKPDKYGKCPIDIIYQIDGGRKKINTGERAHPINWNTKGQEAIFVPIPKVKKELKGTELDGVNPDKIAITEIEVKDLNANLTKITANFRAIEQRFTALSKPYSIHDIAEEYKASLLQLEKKSDYKNSLVGFIDRFISEHSEKLSSGTITIYETLQGNLKDYQVKEKKVFTFDDVNYSFFQGFQNYLIKTGNLNNNTIAKKLSYLKGVINYAVDKCDIAVNPKYRSFATKREEPKIIALTQAEFNALLNHDFGEDKRLERVRDVFCFSCTSGLRHSDLAQLRWDHIKSDEINLVIQKTGKSLDIPLNAISAAILEKYRDQRRPLPIISNQKFNEYIKLACEKAEINEPIEIVRFVGSKRTAEVLPKHKLIHVHTGRKTFVTLSLEKGMIAEHVMAITGHGSYKAFKRYVDFTKKTAKVVMGNAWGEVPKLKVVNS